MVIGSRDQGRQIDTVQHAPSVFCQCRQYHGRSDTVSDTTFDNHIWLQESGHQIAQGIEGGIGIVLGVEGHSFTKTCDAILDTAERVPKPGLPKDGSDLSITVQMSQFVHCTNPAGASVTGCDWVRLVLMARAANAWSRSRNSSGLVGSSRVSNMAISRIRERFMQLHHGLSVSCASWLAMVRRTFRTEPCSQSVQVEDQNQQQRLGCYGEWPFTIVLRRFVPADRAQPGPCKTATTGGEPPVRMQFPFLPCVTGVAR